METLSRAVWPRYRAECPSQSSAPRLSPTFLSHMSDTVYVAFNDDGPASDPTPGSRGLPRSAIHTHARSASATHTHRRLESQASAAAGYKKGVLFYEHDVRPFTHPGDPYILLETLGKRGVIGVLCLTHFALLVAIASSVLTSTVLATDCDIYCSGVTGGPPPPSTCGASAAAASGCELQTHPHTGVAGNAAYQPGYVEWYSPVIEPTTSPSKVDSLSLFIRNVSAVELSALDISKLAYNLTLWSCSDPMGHRVPLKPTHATKGASTGEDGTGTSTSTGTRTPEPPAQMSLCREAAGAGAITGDLGAPWQRVNISTGTQQSLIVTTTVSGIFSGEIENGVVSLLGAGGVDKEAGYARGGEGGERGEERGEETVCVGVCVCCECVACGRAFHALYMCRM